MRKDLGSKDPNSMTNNSFFLFHGGRRIEGMPEITQKRLKRSTAGPGIYFTNSYARAKSYGKVMRAEIKSNIILSSSVSLPVDQILEFLSQTSRIKNRNKIVNDVIYDVDGSPRDTIIVEHFLNLLLCHEAGKNSFNYQLCLYLQSLKIDATLHKQSGQEEWLLVHNPAVIKNWHPATLGQQDPDLPLPSSQIAS